LAIHDWICDYALIVELNANHRSPKSQIDSRNRKSSIADVMRAAAAFVLSFVVVTAATRPSTTHTQSTPAAPASIPLELENRHLIVKARVNGSGPLSFLLDTGANRAINRMDPAKALALSLEGTVSAGGAGPGRQTGARVKNASWSLAGLERFAQPISFALPLPELPAALASWRRHDRDRRCGSGAPDADVDQRHARATGRA
jgi:predicted aspartyl protease